MWKFALMTLPMVLSACAPWSVETPVIDREFGQAQASAWSQEIAYPDGRFADTTPQAVAGIHAERAMKAYNKTYDRKTTKPNTMRLGVFQGGGGGGQ